MDVSPPRLFPYCVVWVPIPFISWLLPFVGHLGVCRSDGTTLDFLGPYNIEVGNFGFGHPTRYWRLEPHLSGTYRPGSGKEIDEWWDEELEYSAAFFRTMFYNFCGTNCHSFVAFFLNQIDYRGSMRWNTVCLAILVFFQAKHVHLMGVLKTWLPFCVMMAVGLYFCGWIFAYTCLIVAVISALYFVFYEYVFQAQARLVERSTRLPIISLGTAD